MINATNPAVSTQNLPPQSLDQEETQTATGENTSANANAATSTQPQTTKPVAEQGISALEYDANFSTTRDPSSADNNQMLMISPSSVNPNATRANVQGQMGAIQNDLTLSSSENKLTSADTGFVKAKSQNANEFSNSKTELEKLAQITKPPGISTKAWQDIVLPIIGKYGPAAAQAAGDGFLYVKMRHNENPDLSNRPNRLERFVEAGKYAAGGDGLDDAAVKFAAFKGAADLTAGAWSKGLLGPNQ